MVPSCSGGRVKTTKARNQASAAGRVKRGSIQELRADLMVDENTQCQPANQVDGGGRQVDASVRTPNRVAKGRNPVVDTSGLATAKRCVEARKELPGPRALQLQNRVRALRLMNRFRQLRAIDLAAGLFPEREFKAALSAAQRLIKGLVAHRMLLRYRSLSGQTYYALGEAGARWLRQNGDASDVDALASASRASDRTNPEHDLWSAFAVLACEHRGLRALTEKEFLPSLFVGRDLRKRSHALAVLDERGQEKGLVPDAIADDGRKNVVWIEIDRSERGAGRLADLVALVGRCGADVYLGSDHPLGTLPLRHIVVLCKTERILRRHISHLTGRNAANGLPRVRTLGGEPALRHIAPGVFDVMRDVERKLPDGRIALDCKAEGRVHFQLLPTWLPSFSYRPGSRHDGWFCDGYLPFKNLPDGWNSTKAR